MALTIELVYVAQDKNTVHMKMELTQGALVRDALVHAQIYENYPETKAFQVGVYGKLVSLDTLLKDGDRVELYRPLALDPKEKRRRLAKNKKK